MNKSNAFHAPSHPSHSSLCSCLSFPFNYKPSSNRLPFSYPYSYPLHPECSTKCLIHIDHIHYHPLLHISVLPPHYTHFLSSLSPSFIPINIHHHIPTSKHPFHSTSSSFYLLGHSFPIFHNTHTHHPTSIPISHPPCMSSPFNTQPTHFLLATLLSLHHVLFMLLIQASPPSTPYCFISYLAQQSHLSLSL